MAQKSLEAKPATPKFAGAVSAKQRLTKFTEPQKKMTGSTTTQGGADQQFLANLGSCLKRRSTQEHDTRKTKMGRYEFETDRLGFVHVWTDGSCVNNGKADARAGLGVYWGEDHAL